MSDDDFVEVQLYYEPAVDFSTRMKQLNKLNQNAQKGIAKPSTQKDGTTYSWYNDDATDSERKAKD